MGFGAGPVASVAVGALRRPPVGQGCPRLVEKVRVWDQTATASPWSDPASFSVGPLSAADWRGDRIGADWMTDNEGPLSWLRETITLRETPAATMIHVAALGYCELYVNGQKVGDEVLSPAVTDYGRRGLYVTHDIAPYLVPGKNRLGRWLGRGWSLGALKHVGSAGPLVKAERTITFDTKMGDGLLQPYVGIGCAGAAAWSFLGDWVPPGRKQGQDRVDDRSTLFPNNCHLVYCPQLASKIGHVVGDDHQADVDARQAQEIAARLHSQFLNADGATYVNGEQTYLAMPLLFGITPPDSVPQVMAALEHDIRVTCGGHLNRGTHGNYFMTKYLIEQRRNDLLSLRHTKTDFPSFGYMLAHDATTIWEEWDGDNSRIHNTMISIGLWFIEGLAGIRYDQRARGFQHFTAAPGVDSGLRRVDDSLMTGYGKITSNWRVAGDTLTWELTVPPNTSATVIIPATGLSAVRESGEAVASQPGVTDAVVERGLFRSQVASGTYHFTSQLPAAGP